MCACVRASLSLSPCVRAFVPACMCITFFFTKCRPCDNRNEDFIGSGVTRVCICIFVFLEGRVVREMNIWEIELPQSVRVGVDVLLCKSNFHQYCFFNFRLSSAIFH